MVDAANEPIDITSKTTGIVEVDPVNNKTSDLNSSESVETNDKKLDEIITDGPQDFSDNGPGPLRGLSKLKLETRKGQMIFEGRKADPKENVVAIIGLRTFASYLRTIWEASGKNDPYADWWLLKVERIIKEKEDWIDAKITEYKEILSQFPNMTHEVAHSISPIERELRFSIPYSFKAAVLLMKHDELIKTIMTAHHVGMVDSNKAHYDMGKSARAARTAFQAVAGYRFTGVSRDDIHSNNPVAQKASELMGPIPFGIQDDEVVPAFQSGDARLRRILRLDNIKNMEKKNKEKKS